MTDEVMATYLEKHDPEKNQHRFYRLSVEPNLFGEWSLVREWGRVGQSCRIKIDLYTRLEEAKGVLTTIEGRKKRRGYRCVPSNARGNLLEA